MRAKREIRLTIEAARAIVNGDKTMLRALEAMVERSDKTTTGSREIATQRLTDLNADWSPSR